MAQAENLEAAAEITCLSWETTICSPLTLQLHFFIHGSEFERLDKTLRDHVVVAITHACVMCDAM